MEVDRILKPPTTTGLDMSTRLPVKHGIDINISVTDGTIDHWLDETTSLATTSSYIDLVPHLSTVTGGQTVHCQLYIKQSHKASRAQTVGPDDEHPFKFQTRQEP